LLLKESLAFVCREVPVHLSRQKKKISA
jgi:hypothetical protein